MLKMDLPVLRTKGEDHEETAGISIGHDRSLVYVHVLINTGCCFCVTIDLCQYRQQWLDMGQQRGPKIQMYITIVYHIAGERMFIPHPHIVDVMPQWLAWFCLVQPMVKNRWFLGWKLHFSGWNSDLRCWTSISPGDTHGFCWLKLWNLHLSLFKAPFVTS